MKDKQLRKYYLFCCIGVLIASYYPLSMGVRVIADMIADGAVLKENYPKYIIPYTPMSIAIIIGVLLMPVFFKFFKRFVLAGGGTVASGVFFALEILFEQKVVVSTAETVTKLEDWQMYMCYVPPEGWGETVTSYKTQTAVDILMGDYNPAFKLHFYIISVVLIVTILNCLYGFAQLIKSGDKKRLKALVLQSVCSLTFLGLCILACFTAFWRDGSIEVSVLSATLMAVFFVLLGVTVGVFVGSFLLGKRKLFSIWIPAVTASVMTLLMYIGEMILLNGHVYRYGNGFLFTGIPGIALAPVDGIIIAASGYITAWIFALLNGSLIHLQKKDDMKRKGVILTLSVIAVIAALVLVHFAVGREDKLEAVSGTVQVLEITSDRQESSYRVGAYLAGTDFSSLGKILEEKMAQEWSTYDSMTREQRMLSSHAFGVVGIQSVTWNDCEKAIGFTVDNPLESLEWLKKTGYFGMDDSDPSSPTTAHVQAIAHAFQATNRFQSIDRKPSKIGVTAGYNYENLRITLTAVFWANAGTYTNGSVINGYATFKQDIASTGSGIPVLIITTDEANNTGYYHGDYFDPTAYWVKDNVFYTLRVVGDEADKAAIQDTLARILAEV